MANEWYVRDDNPPNSAFEEILVDLLDGFAAHNSERRAELAEQLVAAADFTSSEAAAWRQRFAARRAELQPAARQAA